MLHSVTSDLRDLLWVCTVMPLRTDHNSPPHFRLQARNPLDTGGEVTYKKRNYGADEGKG